MKFKIEKDIPIPSVQPNGISATLRAMEIGDSVALDGVPKTTAKTMPSVVGKATGRKFTFREIDGVVRVWRVS